MRAEWQYARKDGSPALRVASTRRGPYTCATLANLKSARVGLWGASGYSGAQALELFANHPSVSLVLATSDKWAGRAVTQEFGASAAWASELRFTPNAEGVAAVRAAGVEIAILATPAEVSAELAPALLALGIRVIDVSGAHRLRHASARAEHYKLGRMSDEVSAAVVYGIPEVAREAIATARLVANPGCYATAMNLALMPLARAGLVSGMVVVSACSGATGAGRQSKEDYSFCEVADDVRAYRVLSHQHTPEVAQCLGDLGAAPVDLVFTPHLLPVRRGILATTTLQLARDMSSAEAHALYTHAYASSAFVRVLADANAVSLKGVVGTNYGDVGVSVRGRTVVVTSAIDNLIKGAAGQAVQNMNLMCGFAEGMGLAGLRRHRP